jgi:hypothetical protein
MSTPPSDPPEPHADRSAEGPTAPTVDRSPAWPWLTLLVAALVAGVLLAWRPWAGSDSVAAAPTPSPSTSSPAPSESAEPTSSTTPSATAAVFDEQSARSLFLTEDDIARAAPATAAGLTVSLMPDDAEWGLPEGSSVDPPSCAAAVTVSTEQPAGYVQQLWQSDLMGVEQSVVLLADADEGDRVLGALADTLADCPEYAQVNPGTDGTMWTAETPETGEGEVPTLLQTRVLSSEGLQIEQVRSHVLVGNAIVTTTIGTFDDGQRPDPQLVQQVVLDRAAQAQAALRG